MDLFVQHMSFKEMKNTMTNYHTIPTNTMDQHVSVFMKGECPAEWVFGEVMMGAVARADPKPLGVSPAARTSAPFLPLPLPQESRETGKPTLLWPRMSALMLTMLRRWQAATSTSAQSYECSLKSLQREWCETSLITASGIKYDLCRMENLYWKQRANLS